MIDRNKFDILKLKGDLDKIIDWMKCHHAPHSRILHFQVQTYKYYIFFEILTKPFDL
jgi:hypothetical protein